MTIAEVVQDLLYDFFRTFEIWLLLTDKHSMGGVFTGSTLQLLHRQQCPPLRAETKLAAASGAQLLGQFN